jgi:hypothetical protein
MTNLERANLESKTLQELEKLQEDWRVALKEVAGQRSGLEMRHNRLEELLSESTKLIIRRRAAEARGA